MVEIGYINLGHENLKFTSCSYQYHMLICLYYIQTNYCLAGIIIYQFFLLIFKTAYVLYNTGWVKVTTLSERRGNVFFMLSKVLINKVRCAYFLLLNYPPKQSIPNVLSNNNKKMIFTSCLMSNNQSHYKNLSK